MLKRKKGAEINKSSDLLIIKENLSNNFKRVNLKSINAFPEFADVILYRGFCVVKAKLIENTDTIHIKVENANGFVYEGFTENYEWFLKYFSFY